MHNLYSNCLYLYFSLQAEFFRESMALVAERTLHAHCLECSLKKKLLVKEESQVSPDFTWNKRSASCYGTASCHISSHLINCYGTASCLILSHLINHASPILSNELSNTSVWLLWNSSLFNLLHFIIVWSCGHYYYKVWQLLGITPHCWLNAKPLLHTAYTQTLFLFSQTIFLLSYFLICSFFHTLSSYLLIFLSLTHLIAGSYPIGGYLDHILLDDKPGLV